ncbi:putative proline utilization protein prnx [Fusarium flagelliforme]|uniref:Putative proline utilization protein prnx n=1 Tax=Fusarium flagelliforme TaxID=2675880 RepID=A0A395MAR7_9HYPO|nr:putative proline utilization protein prnx [Fusarium flagelliforme]
MIDELSNGLRTFTDEHRLPLPQRTIHQPMRTHFTNQSGDRNLFMPSTDGILSTIKLLTVPGNGDPAQGLVVISKADGRPLGLISAGPLTAFRTALATMTMFVRSPLPKENITVFGAGPVAAWHARLAVLLYPDEVQRVTFIGRSPARLRRLIQSATDGLQQLSLDVKVDSLSQNDPSIYPDELQHRISTSDALFCCTSSTEPLFPHRYLEAEESGQNSKPRFISLVGSHKPDMQEVEVETLLSGGGKVYVDTKEGCLTEAGEIVKAKLGEGDLTEIGEVFQPGAVIGVEKHCNIVYKSVGFGLMDLIVGKLLLDAAKEEGLGTKVKGF